MIISRHIEKAPGSFGAFLPKATTCTARRRSPRILHSPLFSAELKPPPGPHMELTPSGYLLDIVSAHAGRRNAVGTEEVAALYLQSTRAPQTFCGLGSAQPQYSKFGEKATDVITLPAEGLAFNLQNNATPVERNERRYACISKRLGARGRISPGHVLQSQELCQVL